MSSYAIVTMEHGGVLEIVKVTELIPALAKYPSGTVRTAPLD